MKRFDEDIPDIHSDVQLTAREDQDSVINIRPVGPLGLPISTSLAGHRSAPSTPALSRLARTGRDWHQLLELCSLSGALLADNDGVYDPGFYNDRLLLGLKGTMSEAELYLIRQRMLSGRLAKAELGELAFQLPIGYLRRPSGEVVFDPRRAGPDGGSPGLRHLHPAGHAERGAALSGRPPDPAAGPGAWRSGQGGAGVAAPDPGNIADHAAQSDLCRVPRLRAAPGRAA
ncbi:hypothetical protein GCM10022224_055070 [Nonomuraea antimicrobica]|uniref:Resolvase/invertase-type recombinase catalytic domain-containing protein n=1 Tax=Nonomuraea antimicrobica TaxID=561173 RepID=A0ABP7CBW5_9ACTN